MSLRSSEAERREGQAKGGGVRGRWEGRRHMPGAVRTCQPRALRVRAAARTTGQRPTGELLPRGRVPPKLAQAADLHTGRPLHRNKSLLFRGENRLHRGSSVAQGRGSAGRTNPGPRFEATSVAGVPGTSLPHLQNAHHRLYKRQVRKPERAQHGPWMMACPLPRHLGGGTCMPTASLFFCFLTV